MLQLYHLSHTTTQAYNYNNLFIITQNNFKPILLLLIKYYNKWIIVKVFEIDRRYILHLVNIQIACI